MTIWIACSPPCGPRLRTLRQQNADHPGGTLGGDRDLGQHAVAAGVWPAPGDARTPAAAWPARTGCRWMNWSAHRRPATPGCTCVPSHRHGMTMVPLTRRAGGVAGLQAAHPGRRCERPLDGQQTHDGYEWLYVLVRSAAVAARRPGSGAASRARPPSSTPAFPHAFGGADAAVGRGVVPLRAAGGTRPRPGEGPIDDLRPSRGYGSARATG